MSKDKQQKMEPSTIEGKAEDCAMRLPTGWIRTALHQLVEIDKDTLSENTDPDYQFFYLSLSDVERGKTNQKLPIIEFKDAPSRARRIIRRGDILFSTVRPYLDGHAQIKDCVYNLVASTGFAVLTPKNKEDREFIYQYLYSTDIKKQIYCLLVGSSYPAINSSDVCKLKLSYPVSIEDRKNIASVLGKWDEAIEKTEQLIAAKQKRFKWSVSQLIGMQKIKKIKLSKFISEVSVRNKNNQVQRVLSVTNHSGFLPPEKIFDKQVASTDLSNYKIIAKGQYAYNPSRINVGSIARLDDEEKGVLSPMYTVFKLDSQLIHSGYFSHWLSSNEAKQRIKGSAQGSVRETVNFDALGNILIPLPALEKQERIADALSSAKKEIEVLKKLSKQFRAQKRGLMQKLLIGKWSIKQ